MGTKNIMSIIANLKVNGISTFEKQMKQAMSSVSTSSFATDISKELDKLKAKAISHTKNTPDTFINPKQVKEALKSGEDIVGLYSKIAETIKNTDVNKLADTGKVITHIKSAEKGMSNLSDRVREYNQLLDGRKEKELAVQKVLAGRKVDTVENIRSYIKKGTLGLDKDTPEYEAKKKSIESQYIGKKSYSELPEVKQLKEVNKDIELTGKSINVLKEQFIKAYAELANNPNLDKLDRTLIEKVKNISTAFDKFSAGDIISDAEVKDLNEISKILSRMDASRLEEAKKTMSGMEAAANEAAPEMARLAKEMKDLETATVKTTETAEKVDMFRKRMLEFFGIENAVIIFKRLIRDAIDTVTELDKAMTETAVVTEFSVGDMWAELPRYTDEANKLGTTILGAYETMTLFYQQGLEQNEAFELGIETMKMARIAGMDYVLATDMMTAALRGFNMELSETSAERVNDVYSKLAAITAADTQEIASAMTRTASIASSAGMEFETTSAFLAQMIETTREAPENLGTAMKTIVARFQELKKDPALIEPIDGEMVDANKVESALRTVDIQLRDSLGQFRDADEVFLEIASKWDGMTQSQQRYIATIAAGSRQQSRFIAMMSNYDRTMELVSAANNSAGASQEQFEKTLESLESKVNKMKNAWAEFLMGLANSSVIKGTVDLLTGLLTIVNNITGMFGSGITKTILEVGLLIATIQGGKKAVNAFFSVFEKRKSGKSSKMSDNFDKDVDKMEKRGKGFAEKVANYFKTFMKKATDDVADDIEQKGKEFDKKIKTRKTRNLKDNLYKLDKNKQYNVTQRKLLDKAPEIETPSSAQFSAKRGPKLKSFTKDGVKVTPKVDIDPKQIKFGGLKGFINSELSYIFGSNLGDIITKKLDKPINAVGDKFTKLGGAAKGVAPKVASIGKAAFGVIQKINPAIAIAVTGIGTAVAAVMHEIIKNSPEKKLERFNNISKETSKSFKKSQDNFSKLKEGLNSYEEINKNLQTITKGSKAWNEEIIKSNNLILDLLDLYPELASQIEETNGRFTLKGGVDKIKKTQEEAIKRQQRLSAQMSLAAFDNDIDKLRREKSTQPMGSDVSEFYKSTTKDSKISEEQIKIDSLQASKKIAGANVLQSLLDPSQYDFSEVQGIVDVYSEDFTKALDNDTKVEKGIQQYKLRTKKQLKDLYSDAFKIPVKDINLSKDELVEALSRSDVAEQAVTALESEISQYDGDIELFTNLKKLESGAVYVNLKFLEKNAEQVANILKVTKEEFLDDLKTIEKEQEKLRQSSINALKTDYKLYSGKDMSKGQSDVLTGLDVTQQQEFANIMADTIDQGTAFTTALADGLLKNKNSFNQLNQEIAKLNFDSPIQSMAGFNKMIESGDKEISQLGKNLKKASQEFASEGHQINEFLSSDYQKLTGKVHEFIEANGELKADNIVELASESEMLNTMLTENGLSAAALANIMEGLDSGAISIDMVNQSLYDMASELDSIEGSAARIQQKIQSYKPGTDYTAGLDFYEERIKEIQEKIKAGEYGNIEAPWDSIFGEGAYQKIIENGGNIQQAIQTQLNRFDALSKDGGVGFIDKLASRDKLGSVKKFEEGYSFNFGALEGKSYQEIIDYYAKLGKVTSEQAEIFLTNFSAYSVDLKKKLEEKRKDAMVDELAETASSGLLTSEKLAQYASLTNQSVEKVRKQILKSDKGPKEIELIDFAQPDTFTAEQVTSVIGFIKKKFKTEVDSGALDLGSVKQKLISEFGITDSEAKEFLNSDKINQALSSITFKNGKKDKTIKIKPIVDKEDDIFKQLQNTKIKFSANLGKVKSDLNILKNQKLNYKADISEVERAIGGIKVPKKTVKITPSLTKVKETFTLNIKKAYEDLKIKGTPDKKGKSSKKGEPAGTRGEMGSYTNWRFASGTNKNGVKKSGRYLTGEEGVELIEGVDQKSYLVGTHGPQYVDLKRGDIVHNNKNTERILKEKRVKGIPRFEEGSKKSKRDDYTTPIFGDKKPSKPSKPSKPGSTASGNDSTKRKKTSSSSSKEEKWKYTLDRLYNLIQKIEGQTRLISKTQRARELLLRKPSTTAKQLYVNIRDEKRLLDAQKKSQLGLIKSNRKHIDAIAKKYPGLFKIDKDANTLKVNTKKAKKLSAKEGKDFDANVAKIEKDFQEIINAKKELEEINDTLYELKEIGKDAYLDLEKRVIDALLQEEEERIDKLSSINDSIDDTNDKLFSAIQDSISEMRQLRDNSDKEKDIADKERRLAYLRQDTSGANALEILQLEKELQQDKEDYTDTLIDQKISDLEKQNNQASEERKRQIELQQKQLEHMKNSGALWDKAHKLLQEGVDATGALITDSDLVKVLQGAEGWDAMSKLQQMDWLDDLKKTVTTGFNFIMNKNQLEGLGGKKPKPGSKITFTTSTGDKKTGTVDEEGNIIVKDKTGTHKFSEVYLKDDGTYATIESTGQTISGSSSSSGSSGKPSSSKPDKKDPPKVGQRVDVKADTKWYSTAYGGGNSGKAKSGKISRVVSSGTHRYHIDGGGWIKLSDIKGYKTGGLADYTGPAWLDGTKSRPEIVLNQQDSQNFLQLKDVLSSVMRGDNTPQGANEFNIDIDIHVDTLSNDYDVDQLTERIKENINKEARYRNVNSINLLR